MEAPPVRETVWPILMTSAAKPVPARTSRNNTPSMAILFLISLLYLLMNVFLRFGTFPERV
jgi:hypothetical protein